MSIRYTCGCGAQIRLPYTAAGRKARCKSCGVIFKVPDRAAVQAGEPASSVRQSPAPAVSTAPAAADRESAAGSWLDEFAERESQAPGGPVRLLDLSFSPEEQEPGSPRAHSLPADRAREDRDWIVDPMRSFWADLAASFFFPLHGGNLVTLLMITAVGVLSVLLRSFPGFGFRGAAFKLFAELLINGYICAFYMSTVVESAGGEDDLPSVSISSLWDDLLMPLVQFAGTWIIVLLPAIIALIATSRFGGVMFLPFIPTGTNWPLVIVLAVGGLVFWPVVVLSVSLGGTLQGALPHLVIRTALCAPLAYLAILGVLLAAAAMAVLTPMLRALLSVSASFGQIIGISILSIGVGTYAMTLSMRVIGLYYRHFKHRFPWAAE